VEAPSPAGSIPDKTWEGTRTGFGGTVRTGFACIRLWLDSAHGRCTSRRWHWETVAGRSPLHQIFITEYYW